ncbi:MAG: hypothetical protein HON94_15985 [Methylococcales bacterium]|nr:hypothetical protein [Methylococcales bacterium]MBT7408941.1 hypothetical protein [Methylococcales bacterium]
MPMKRDPDGGGTMADGTKSIEYCSLCFKNGEFLQVGLTATEMQDFCIEKMTECKVPKFIAWLFTRGIPKLKRWSK